MKLERPPRAIKQEREGERPRGTSTGVRRSMVGKSNPIGGVRPNAGENGQIGPSTSIRVARGAGSRPHLASVLKEG